MNWGRTEIGNVCIDMKKMFADIFKNEKKANNVQQIKSVEKPMYGLKRPNINFGMKDWQHG